MSSAHADRPRPTGEQEHAFAASTHGRDRTLDAVHSLERALGSAAIGKEENWVAEVSVQLAALQSATSDERDESMRPDSLLSIIRRDDPRHFGPRIRQLRRQLDDIARQIESMQEELDHLGDGTVDPEDLRQRLGWLVSALRYRRARETDLVFEALGLDLGSV